MRALVQTEFRETFLEIRELKPQHRLVTAIEVLSPSNKREQSPGWALYLRKRQASDGACDMYARFHDQMPSVLAAVGVVIDRNLCCIAVEQALVLH